MASSGELTGEAPRACPFVALEHDRDRRSDEPDYRHRCFAEPTPAPRAIAHQEAYCLSPNFAACAVFQDWATRAAARPVSPEESAEDRLAVAGGAAAAAAAVPPVAMAATEEPAADEMDDVERYQRPVEPAEPEQLGAFDSRPTSDLAEPDEEPDEEPEPPAPVEEPSTPPPPAFLANREPPRAPPQQPYSQAEGAQFTERVKREDVVPSWEIDGRYGAQVSEPGNNDRFGNVITAIAVVAILAIGVAGVIFLPGLLAGGDPARTAVPSVAIPTSAPATQTAVPATAAPTDAPTAEPTVAPTATPSAAPQASPLLYRVQPGDNIARIARRENTTVAEILAANPRIEDPNHIQVGQVIVIPVAAPE